MSTAVIPDLWSDDIRVDVIEPVAILRVQESALSTKTHGLLRAEVRSVEQVESGKEAESKIIHSLDLIAPALKEYRVTLMTAIHAVELIYPVLARSRVFDSEFKQSKVSIPKVGGSIPLNAIMASQADFWGLMLNQKSEPHPEFRLAATQDEFISLVGEVLQSVWVRSLIQSLIARSNAITLDKNGSKATPGEQLAE